MEIHPAKDTQLLEVLYIIRECAEQLTDKGVRTWHNTHTDYAEISNDIKSKHVFIVFFKKVPVGTITVKPHAESPGIAHIDRLAIFPHFQGRGFAKAMIDFAEKHTREKGFNTLRGTIPVDDKALCKLLEDKGFKNMGVLHNIPNELIKIVFEKKLG
jgi:ribosomal protein S18 acetylase RimI-like enzyme